MWRLLACCLSIALLLSGCGGEPVSVVVQYPEFGEEFLPSVIELFERGGEEGKQCTMVYVLWALESRFPSLDTGVVSSASVLCLCEGITATGNPLFRFVHVNRGKEQERVVWKQAFRVSVDAEGAYSGSRLYSARPTLEEFEKFVKRAQLENDIKFQNLKLANCKTNSHHFFVHAKVYEQECMEVFGRIPAFLKQHTQERYADDPAPKTEEKK